MGAVHAGHGVLVARFTISAVGVRRGVGKTLTARRPDGRTASVLVIGAVLGCSMGAATSNRPQTVDPWTQVWNDEFDGAAGAPVDAAKWRYDTADGCASSNCGWGNNEKESYRSAAANIALNGQGQLAIVARVAAPGLICYYGPCRYTSAKITTRDRVDVAPGRVVARIRLAPGQGLWPAFWLLGHGTPPKP